MSGYNKDTCTAMFIATLFIQPRDRHNPDTTNNEWIEKMWILYIMEFYSAMKNEILLFGSKWMEPEK
jgi:hypothetical protein